MKSIECAQGINRAFLRDRRSCEQRVSMQTNPIRLPCAAKTTAERERGKRSFLRRGLQRRG